MDKHVLYLRDSRAESIPPFLAATGIGIFFVSVYILAPGATRLNLVMAATVGGTLFLWTMVILLKREAFILVPEIGRIAYIRMLFWRISWTLFPISDIRSLATSFYPPENHMISRAPTWTIHVFFFNGRRLDFVFWDHSERERIGRLLSATVGRPVEHIRAPDHFQGEGI